MEDKLVLDVPAQVASLKVKQFIVALLQLPLLLQQEA
jgi:hypothetical protein